MSTNTPTNGSSSAEIPAVVTEAAHQRQLGQLLDVQQSPPQTPFATVLLIGGIASVALGIGLAAWGMALDGDPGAKRLGLAACFFIFAIGPVMLIWSVRLFLRGGQGYYLYRGGVVHVRRGRARALPWSEISAITRRRSGTELNDIKAKDGNVYSIKADSVVGYFVQPRSGGKLEFAVGNIFPDHIRFASQLEQLATQAGIPISG